MQIFPFQESVYAAWKHLQKAKRNKRTQAAECDEAECFLSTWQETLAQLEFCDTQMRKSTITYLFSCNLGPQNISIKFRGPNSSRWFQWSPSFLCCHFPFITANLIHKKSKFPIGHSMKIKKSLKNHGLLDGRHNHTLQEDPRGHQHRWGAAVQSSLLKTSLVLNANVQLCSDFFLRTSCRPPNNDCRGLPPLSLLKYGNCIIETLEPLFSHGWGGTGTCSVEKKKKRPQKV